MATLPLLVDGVEVALYDDGADLPEALSPRPFLHPVRSPAGVVATEVQPEDHRHHIGVSLAIADISGTTYWGGASYVHPDGYTMLANQGRQIGEEPRSTATPGGTTVDQRLTWHDADAAPQVLEDRRLELALADLDGTAATTLRWCSTITPVAGDLLIGSPATRGRVGAGYGGLFWRLGPERPTRVRIADAEGEDAVLGSTTPWLTLTQDRETGPLTVLLGQPEDAMLPWFVRATGYVGAGPAVAWDPEPVPLRAGERRDLQLWAAVVDADLDARSAQVLYETLSTPTPRSTS